MIFISGGLYKLSSDVSPSIPTPIVVNDTGFSNKGTLILHTAAGASIGAVTGILAKHLAPKITTPSTVPLATLAGTTVGITRGLQRASRKHHDAILNGELR